MRRPSVIAADAPPEELDALPAGDEALPPEDDAVLAADDAALLPAAADEVVPPEFESFAQAARVSTANAAATIAGSVTACGAPSGMLDRHRGSDAGVLLGPSGPGWCAGGH